LITDRAGELVRAEAFYRERREQDDALLGVRARLRR
jgi:hypothetical protein